MQVLIINDLHWLLRKKVYPSMLSYHFLLCDRYDILAIIET